MKEEIKDCLLEIQDLILAIKDTVKKHGLEKEFIGTIAVGFINPDSASIDEDGEPMVNMSLLSMVDVEDEDELDDLLSYVVEIYRAEVEEEKRNNTSSIDYWINLSRRDGDVN
jgi:hypothetical protein